MTRVAYVGGWGRSGSTLLDRILGRVPGFVSVGELRMIWRRGLVLNASCGCGESFAECPFWQGVGRRAYGGWDRVDVDEVISLRQSLDRGWSTPALASPFRPRGSAGRVARYAGYLGPLYRAIAEEAGASVVVDSSKLPSHAVLVRQVRSVDLRVVHLVRDPRGVAYSWQKDVVKDPSTGEKMLRYRPWSAAVRYDVYNALTGLLRHQGIPYLRVRYEDLVAEPARTVGRIATFFDPGVTDLAFIDGSQVTLGVDHIMGGNPIRFTQGPTTIRQDESWKERLPSIDRAWVTALTVPMLVRYGYPIRVDGAAAGHEARASG